MGKLIHEKNQKSKISWHCPFNSIWYYIAIPRDFFKFRFCGSANKATVFTSAINLSLIVHVKGTVAWDGFLALTNPCSIDRKNL